MPTDSIDFSLGPIVSAAIDELPPNPCFGQIVNAAVHDLPPIEVGGFTHGQLVAATIGELPPNPCFGAIVSLEVLGIVHEITEGFLI